VADQQGFLKTLSVGGSNLVTIICIEQGHSVLDFGNCNDTPRATDQSTVTPPYLMKKLFLKHVRRILLNFIEEASE
jgi:hypothetical protein